MEHPNTVTLGTSVMKSVLFPVSTIFTSSVDVKRDSDNPLIESFL